MRRFLRLISIIDFFLPEAARKDLRRAQPARILIAICLVGAILEPIMSLRHFLLGHNLAGGILTLGIGLFGFALLAAIRRGLAPRIAMDVMASVVVVGGAVVSITRGGFFISTVMAATLVPLAVGLIGRQRATLVWAAIVGATLGALALVTHFGIGGLRRETAVDVGPLLVFLVGVTVLAVVHEHTRMSLEREKEVLRHRMALAERLEALGHLAAGVAHDFNNLLTIFQTAGEVMVEELPEDHPLRADAEAVREAANRGATIARQLLAFSRPQTSESGPFDLVACVTEMEPILRRALPQTIALHIDASSTKLRVLGDTQQLMNVVLNLVVNARDALPRGGSVAVSVGTTVVEEALPGALAPGPYATIAVRDDGAGIAADVLPHIFEPFFTTKTRERGSGLGLATAYGAIRAMKGEIRVETAAGHGSTFEILLPLLDPSAVEATGPVLSTHPPSHARRTVLVVDDQPELAAATRRLLERDFDILTASGAEEALATFRGRTDIDVVLTDVCMPSIGGVDLAASLRALKPSIAIVYMTGYSEDEAISREVDAGTAQLIRKPFQRANLTREIERAFRPKKGRSRTSG
ncbi:MAG TPA: ATP-binding protein [Polyangiaceae bacterium]